MPFPDHLVYDGETVVLDLRPHWWYFSRHIGTGIPLVVLVFAAASIHNHDVRSVANWPVAILVLVWAVWLAFKYLQWLRTYFVITDHRVLYRTGILARHGVEIPLDRIANINFHQSIWERIIGAGDLDIESAGERGDAHFDNVRHPDEVQQEIYREMEGHAAWHGATATVGTTGTAAWGTPTATGGDDVADKVAQLARLRDLGHITQDEFERRKNRLLDQL